MEMCARMGHCLVKAGLRHGRPYDWWDEYFIMMDVHQTKPHYKRLACKAGKLWLPPVWDGMENEAHGTSHVFWSVPWGTTGFSDVYSHSVDLMESLPGADADIMEALKNAELSMKVVLCHRPTGKMALWYTSGEGRFVPEDAYGMRGPKTLMALPQRGLCFEFMGSVRRSVFGGPPYRCLLDFQIRSNKPITCHDLKPLVESLDWV